MKINKKLLFFRHPESIILTTISIFLSINIALLANRKSQHSIFSANQNPDLFYLALMALTIAAVFFSAHFSKSAFLPTIKKIFLTFIPFEVTLLASLYFWKPQLSVVFFLFALIFLFIGSFILLIKFPRLAISENDDKKQTFKEWLKSQQKSTLATLLLTMMLFGFFANHRLAEFSAVDEALWTFDRIPSFWKNVSQKNWNNTNISDKPGITVALVSGVGLTQINPKQHDPEKIDYIAMNRAFRFPLIAFATLMLPLLFFLLERLLGQKIALISTALIGTSPILIGMSRIINPDALLWIFAPISLISFLVYQKKKKLAYLYLAGIFIGLSILTKYVANILYVFFFGMIFLEYIFNQARYEKISVSRYIASSASNFGLLVLTSLATFCLLYPGTWLSPERIFKGTILSQAFVTTWPIFLTFIILLFSDLLFLKSKVTASILSFFAQKKHLLKLLISGAFSIIILFVFLNVFSEMKIYDFENILTSPKTAYKENGFWGIYISNFYPLLFGVAPLALLGVVVTFIKIFLERENSNNKNLEQLNVGIFLGLFVFAYYFGATINDVVSTTRYQIMIYPLFFIISAIGIVSIIEKISEKFQVKKQIFFLFSFLVLVICSSSLFFSKPFYLSYASKLLPQKYFLDVKDMGPGSFEVAQYLNSLPNAEKLSIWTDKKGVCNFFVGFCYGDLSYDELKDVSLDYVAVSWGRESRTTNMVRSQGRLAGHPVFNFAKYYNQTENIAYELLIGDRPGQYIRVFKVK